MFLNRQDSIHGNNIADTDLLFKLK